MSKYPVLTAKTSEKDIEGYLVKRVKGCGGEAIKFTSPQRSNVPDRIVLVPTMGMGGKMKGEVVFVELKAPGESPTSGQLREHKRLLDLGFAVYVLDSYDSVNAFMKAEFGK